MMFSKKTLIRKSLEQGKSVEAIAADLSNHFKVEVFRFKSNKWVLDRSISVYHLQDALDHARSILELKMKKMLDVEERDFLKKDLEYKFQDLLVKIKTTQEQ